MRDPVLTRTQRTFLEASRRAVLATLAPDGAARLVPICFVIDPRRPILYTPLDEKPKTVADPTHLARVRDIVRDPRVSVLVDRWEEEWTMLAWLRCLGTATVIDPGGDGRGRPAAIGALRAKYPQYASHDLEARPLIRVVIGHATSWGVIGLV